MNFLAFWIARQFRKGRKKSKLVFIVSCLSTFSIAIGIAALIIGLSAMNGFERELRNRILTFIPDVEIFSVRNNPLQNWELISQQLLAQKDIIAVMPTIQFSGLLKSKGIMRPAQIQAIDDQTQIQLKTHSNNLITQDSWNNFDQTPNSILLGNGLAEKLKVQVGDEITLMIAQQIKQTSDENLNRFQNPEKIQFKVSGIIYFNGELGNYLSYIHLAKAQSIFHLGNTITALNVSVSNPFQVNKIISTVDIQADEPLRIQTWQNQDNRKYYNIYQDIKMIRTVMYLAMIVVIVVACFSIVAFLVIAVKDKQKEIAILKTMGASNRLIYQIFISYGLISGTIGALIGLIIAFFVLFNFTFIFDFFEKISGTKLLNSDIYFIDFVPIQVELQDIVIVFILTVCISFLASFYPAKRATKIDPVLLLKD